MRVAVPVLVAAVACVVLGGCSTTSDDSSAPPPPPASSTTAPSLDPQDAQIVAAAGSTPAGSCHAKHVASSDPQAWEPDPNCTPGAVDGGLSMAQLCPTANTKTIRPPAVYTDALKRAQMRAYGDNDDPAGLEEDHLIPLALGGAPHDPQNLWPQPGKSINEKDRVESAAHDAVCAGKLGLAEAQHKIATDWYQLGKDLNVIH